MPGELPSGWERTTIGDVAEPGKYACIGGPFGSDLTSDDYVPNGVPVIRGGNLSAGAAGFKADGFVYVSEQKADLLSRNLAYPGDLVLTQRGTLGQVALIPEDCPFPRLVVSQSQMKVTLDTRRVFRPFVYQYMTSNCALKELENRTIATGVPHINLGILKSFPLPLPPLPEQKKIAAILSSVDEAIQATQAVIDQTRRVKEGLLQDLLTRGIGHTRFKQTAIGEIPESWEVTRLDGLLSDGPRNGVYKPASDIGEGILIIGQTAFTADRTVDCSAARRARATEDDIARYGLREADILITRVYATQEGCGRPAIVLGLPELAIYESNMMRIRVNEVAATSGFVFNWLQHPVARRSLMAKSSSSNQTSINQETVGGLACPRPPLDEQRSIMGVLSACDGHLARVRSEIGALSMVKSALLDDLLTGRVRVTP